MKKCPECGNPSYDGAPVCGNCGYTFPKPKVEVSNKENIFQQEPKAKKASDDESVMTILKNNKILIGAILIITIIVICGIVLTGSHNNSTPKLPLNNVEKYSAGDFSFEYPSSWNKVNGSDEDHNGAVFFKNGNNTTIEYYNITSEATSLKEINQQRITASQEKNDYVELVETITLDGRNSSNMILENANGNYTRYVSMFSDGELYVFKITGDSINSVTSEDIENTLKTADIA